MVVARLGSQFGHALPQIAHLSVFGNVDTHGKHRHRGKNHDACRPLARQPRQDTPDTNHGLLGRGAERGVLPIRQQSGQQELVRENHHQDTQRGGVGKLAHNSNRNKGNNKKAQAIGKQCHSPRNKELAEGLVGGLLGITTGHYLKPPGIGHLHRMRDGNGKNKKGHKNGKGVKTQPHQGHQPQQPDHGNHCAAQGIEGQHDRAAVEI